MQPRFAIYQTPIGELRIEYLQGRLLRLSIEQEGSGDLGERDPFSQRVYTQIMEYMSGDRFSFDVEIDLDSMRCTPFQRRVLMELLKIPYGESRSYKDIAEAIGNPKASRAVGSACNRNPILIIIPCHRVVGADGAMRGYAGGVGVKRLLLERERIVNG